MRWMTTAPKKLDLYSNYKIRFAFWPTRMGGYDDWTDEVIWLETYYENNYMSSPYSYSYHRCKRKEDRQEKTDDGIITIDWFWFLFVMIFGFVGMSVVVLMISKLCGVL